MRAASLLFGAFASWVLCAAPPAQQSGRQWVVARAQPSVLQLVASFDARVTRPSNLDWALDRTGQPTVRARFAANRIAGISQEEFAWRCIAEDPGQHLLLFGAPNSFIVQDQPMSLGTGFVVDGAGTMLTNQHVIAPELVAADPESLASFVAADLPELLRGIVRLVGAPPPADLTDALDATLVPWLLSHYSVDDVALHEVRVTTRLRPQTIGVRLHVQPQATPPQPDWKESTVPCQVLVTGEIFPGRDVAVVRAASLADKLISLPLGDSRRVIPGTPVVALGFPGAAAETYGVDAEAARFRVIAHDGIVDQRLPVKGGWEAFHMTANTNHGDSGGPVLDETGHVIAMTVAGNPRAPAQNLSIPIEIARQQLQRVNITPGRNKVTETWNRACDELQANRVAAALPLFEDVNRLQGGRMLGGLGTGQATEMVRYCRRELGLPEITLLPAGVGAAPRTGAPPPPTPPVLTNRPLQLSTPVGVRDQAWWEIAWSMYGELNLSLQILIPVALLALLIGGVRKVYGWIAG